jgi:hypothetical protein
MENLKPTKQNFFKEIASNFSDHVRESIPLYANYMNSLYTYLANNQKRASVLDICGSRGDLGKWSRFYGFLGLYMNLDGSREMIAESMEQNQHIYDRSIMAGWRASWTQDDYFVSEWNSDERFDVVVENLGFQFMGSSERSAHIREVKKHIRNSGVFVTCEKFITDNWDANEQLKDKLWKSRFFTPEEIAEKKSKVLNDMHNDLAYQPTYENTLKHYFRYVAKIYQAGNFIAYVCSDSAHNVLDAVAHFESDAELLNNKYTTK